MKSVNSLWSSDPIRWRFWANFGLGNYLLPFGTKPLTEPNVDTSSVRTSGIYLRVISQQIFQSSITEISVNYMMLGHQAQKHNDNYKSPHVFFFMTTIDCGKLLRTCWRHLKLPTRSRKILLSTPLTARFMGPAWGPSGDDRTQVGPMLAPRTLPSESVLRTVQELDAGLLFAKTVSSC